MNKKEYMDIDVFPRLVSKAQADRALPYETAKASETVTFCKVRRTWKNNVLDTVAFIVAAAAIVGIWILAAAI